MKIKSLNKKNKLTLYTRYNTDVVGTHLLVSHKEHNQDKEDYGNLVLFTLMCDNISSLDSKLKSNELVKELINKANEIVEEYTE